MMTWLTKYIDENKTSWERRRHNKRQDDEKELKKWKEMNKDEMIEELKSEESRNSSSSSVRDVRRQKAEQRRKNWKEWREEEEVGDDIPQSEVNRMERYQAESREMKRRKLEWKIEKGKLGLVKLDQQEERRGADWKQANYGLFKNHNAGLGGAIQENIRGSKFDSNTLQNLCR